MVSGLGLGQQPAGLLVVGSEGVRGNSPKSCWGLGGGGGGRGRGGGVCGVGVGGYAR